MPSPLDIAHMCLATYEPSDDGKASLAPPGWEWDRSLSREFRGRLTFSALVFRHPEMLKTVIAIRGTLVENIADLRACLDILLHGTGQHFSQNPRELVDLYITRAQEIATEIQGIFPNDEIILGGHSLGALVAEVTALESNLSAVTFDSPGSLPFVNPQYQNDQARRGRITTYLAAPHLINTRHAHTANQNLYMVYIPSIAYVQSEAMTNFFERLRPQLYEYMQNTLEAVGNVAEEMVLYSLRQHYLANIVLAFNPDTQQPFRSLRIRNWVNEWKHGALRQGVIATGQIFAPDHIDNIANLADYLSGLEVERRFAPTPIPPSYSPIDQSQVRIIGACVGISLLTCMLESDSFAPLALQLLNLFTAILIGWGLSQSSSLKANSHQAAHQLVYHRLHHAALLANERREPDVWHAYLASGHALRPRYPRFNLEPLAGRQVVSRYYQEKSLSTEQWGTLFVILSTVFAAAAAPTSAPLRTAFGIGQFACAALFFPVLQSAKENIELQRSLAEHRNKRDALTNSNDLTPLHARIDSFRR